MIPLVYPQLATVTFAATQLALKFPIRFLSPKRMARSSSKTTLLYVYSPGAPRDFIRKRLTIHLPQEFQQCVTLATASSVTLNDNQYGALVSWSYNVGCGAAQESSLLQRLNGGESPNTVASDELPKWNKGGGEVLPGLVRRRAAEVELHNTASDTEALPVGC